MGEICLEAIDISKSYRRVKAVEGLSFQIRKGQVFGLIGTNGAGKSTTVSMAATLMKPDSGKILYFGKEARGNLREIRGRMGYVPQDIALYETLSGMDNLKFWGRACGLKKSGLEGRIRMVSQMIGLADGMLQRKVQEYSGGMKRRLNIAAALLKQPELVILDEPTAGIDIQSRNMILDAIRALAAEGAAILYVGHYMEEVEQLCGQICIMKDGHALLNAPLSEALQTEQGKITLEQLYRKILKD